MHCATLLSLAALATHASNCRGNTDRTTPGSDMIAATQTINPNQRWVAQGLPVTLDQLARPVDAPNPPFYHDSDSCSIPFSAIANLSQSLATAHNQIVEKTLSPTYENPWITAPITTSGLEIAFIAKTTNVDTTASLAYQSLAIQAGSIVQIADVRLVVAHTARTVAITDAARACLRAHICGSPDITHDRTHQIISKVVYGSMVRLRSDGGEVRANAGASVGEMLQVSFSFASGSIAMDGGVIGLIAAGGYATEASDIDELYDVPQIRADLESNQLLKVSEQLDARTRRYGIVALELEDVACPREPAVTTEGPADTEAGDAEP